MFPWINTILAILSFFFMLATVLSLWRSVRIASGLQESLEQMGKLQLRLTQLETDFMDKYEHTLRKLTARASMRKNREEAEETEDLNKPNGGIITNGPVRQH